MKTTYVLMRKTTFANHDGSVQLLNDMGILPNVFLSKDSAIKAMNHLRDMYGTGLFGQIENDGFSEDTDDSRIIDKFEVWQEPFKLRTHLILYKSFITEL